MNIRFAPRFKARSVYVSVASCICALPLLASLSTGTAQTQPTQDNTWQYSVALEKGTERRAYLWIPPRGEHVRGVLIGIQNMLERPMFEDSEIRAAISASNMAIVWISPGAWPGKLAIPEQPSLRFSPSDDAINGVQRALTKLAHESGYSEIETAPLLVTGHSAASPFVWGMASALPDRVFAAIPYKGYTVGLSPDEVPTLEVAQEWAEWGPQWGEVWRKELNMAAEMRKKDGALLIGVFADIGSGHFDWRHESASVIATFIRKAAEYRLPANGQLQGAIKLKPIALESGVLVDPASLGTARFRTVPYREWHGDPKDALWYFDREMAEAIQHFMMKQLDKKPQAIDFVVGGKPVPLVSNGFAAIKPEFLADGITFRVRAEALNASATANLYNGATLGHAAGQVLYRVGSGALFQTGPDTFQAAARSGGLTRQGQPWEPWIIANQPGDMEYRSADKPAHILIDIRNTRGLSQEIAFQKISDIDRSDRQITLSATSSSGLPVQLYVESGPAEIEGNTLHLLPIPPRSRYPVRVIVSAFQWGRIGEHSIQSAGPETQEFFIRR
jgi:hypothetical protein